MSIVIRHLGKEQGATTLALLTHGEFEFTAMVHGSKGELVAHLNQDCLVEMSFEKLVSWRELPEFDDKQSCIRSATHDKDAITLSGRVHSITEVDERSQTLDLYLQTGPEFLAISSEELGGSAPKVGTALEITVHGLCFYPTGA
jgi:hypothetical protein